MCEPKQAILCLSFRLSLVAAAARTPGANYRLGAEGAPSAYTAQLAVRITIPRQVTAGQKEANVAMAVARGVSAGVGPAGSMTSAAALVGALKDQHAAVVASTLARARGWAEACHRNLTEEEQPLSYSRHKELGLCALVGLNRKTFEPNKELDSTLLGVAT
jgi:hypothetical protein